MDRRSPVHAMAAAVRDLLTTPDDPAVREHARLLLALYDKRVANYAIGSKALKDAEHTIGAQALVIDGRRFDSAKQAYRAARGEGFDGGEDSFRQRVRKNLPWSEIVKPVDKKRQAARVNAITIRRDEMAKVCKDIPRRTYD